MDAPVFERLLEALEDSSKTPLPSHTSTQQQHSIGQPVLAEACRVLLHQTLQLLPLDRANITRFEDTANKFLARTSTASGTRFTLTAVAETTVLQKTPDLVEEMGREVLLCLEYNETEPEGCRRVNRDLVAREVGFVRFVWYTEFWRRINVGLVAQYSWFSWFTYVLARVCLCGEKFRVGKNRRRRSVCTRNCCAVCTRNCCR